MTDKTPKTAIANPDPSGSAKSGAGSKARCPICRAPTQQASRPFCSRACADVDLSRWLRGAYVIQGQSADDDEDGDGADAPPEPLDRPDKPGSY
jgi:uncharacterized protein